MLILNQKLNHTFFGVGLVALWCIVACVFVFVLCFAIGFPYAAALLLRSFMFEQFCFALVVTVFFVRTRAVCSRACFCRS